MGKKFKKEDRGKKLISDVSKRMEVMKAIRGVDQLVNQGIQTKLLMESPRKDSPPAFGRLPSGKSKGEISVVWREGRALDEYRALVVHEYGHMLLTVASEMMVNHPYKRLATMILEDYRLEEVWTAVFPGYSAPLSQVSLKEFEFDNAWKNDIELLIDCLMQLRYHQHQGYVAISVGNGDITEFLMRLTNVGTSIQRIHARTVSDMVAVCHDIFKTYTDLTHDIIDWIDAQLRISPPPPKEDPVPEPEPEPEPESDVSQNSDESSKEGDMPEEGPEDAGTGSESEESEEGPEESDGGEGESEGKPEEGESEEGTSEGEPEESEDEPEDGSGGGGSEESEEESGEESEEGPGEGVSEEESEEESKESEGGPGEGTSEEGEPEEGPGEGGSEEGESEESEDSEETEEKGPGETEGEIGGSGAGDDTSTERCPLRIVDDSSLVEEMDKGLRKVFENTFDQVIEEDTHKVFDSVQKNNAVNANLNSSDFEPIQQSALRFPRKLSRFLKDANKYVPADIGGFRNPSAPLSSSNGAYVDRKRDKIHFTIEICVDTSGSTHDPLGSSTVRRKEFLIAKAIYDLFRTKAEIIVSAFGNKYVVLSNDKFPTYDIFEKCDLGGTDLLGSMKNAMEHVKRNRVHVFVAVTDGKTGVTLRSELSDDIVTRSFLRQCQKRGTYAIAIAVIDLGVYISLFGKYAIDASQTNPTDKQSLQQLMEKFGDLIEELHGDAQK